jgi:hypothetical protein
LQVRKRPRLLLPAIPEQARCSQLDSTYRQPSEQPLSSERHDPAGSEDRLRRTFGAFLEFARISRAHKVKLRPVGRIG